MLFITALYLTLIATFIHTQSINEGEVCSMERKTYGSLEELDASKESVLHCGKCGKCSTVHDISIYYHTRSNLTLTARWCAIKNMILGESYGRSCLEADVGFTSGCSECWVDNFSCTARKCRFVCLGYFLFGIGRWEGHLNPCYACDERKCGPAFIDCAGANRRRSGIRSDIPRDGEEICNSVNVLSYIEMKPSASTPENDATMADML